jgi:hypothetical protein
MFVRSLIAAALAVAVAPAHAAVITQWNFNSITPDANTATGTIIPSLGAGTIAAIGGVTTTFASGDASGGSSDPATGDDSGFNTTTYAAQGAGNKTRGIEVRLSTVGFQDIVVSWDQRHSNTSSRHVQFQYSTDGSTFTDFGGLFEANAGDTWFNGRTVNLGSILGVNDNANFALRIVAAFAPGTSTYLASNPGSTYGTTGTWRFDMVTVSGTVIPVPAAVWLLGSAVAGMAAVARRKAA